MTQQVGYHDITQIAGADLSTSRYRFCKISADYTVTRAGAAAVDCVGIIQDDLATAAGLGVLVRPFTAQTSWIEMGAAVAAGAPVAPNADGKGITATTGQTYYARALQAATADGDIVECMLTKGVV